MSTKSQHCSFCGKPKEETQRLITGPDGVCICDECITVCKSMIDEWATESAPEEEIPLKKPSEIKEELDKYIVGQHDAKKAVAVALRNRYRRRLLPEEVRTDITPKNILIYILYQLLVVAIFYTPVVLLILLAAHLTEGMSETVRIAVNEIILFASLFGLLLFLRKGPANRHTANDNTSGVVTVLTLLDKIGTDKDAAFILFDNEENGMQGSKAYAAAHPNVKNHRMIVNLDCVSDGDNILLFCSKAVKKDSYCKDILDRAETVLSEFGKAPLIPKGFTFYPSDQTSFNRYIAVAALKKSKLVGYYMDKIHTHKDTDL